MDDPKEWLVEYRVDGEPTYDHFESVEEATTFLRANIGRGYNDATLYQRIPFTVQVDVTVHAPRKRRKTLPPAAAPDSATPHEKPGNGEAGEPKEGAASPHAAEAGATQGVTQSAERVAACEPAGNPASPVSLVPPVDLWACEVDTYAGDPPCPGPILYDPATHGRFCGLHMVEEVSVRAEWHRRNRERNRPLRIAG